MPFRAAFDRRADLLQRIWIAILVFLSFAVLLEMAIQSVMMEVSSGIPVTSDAYDVINLLIPAAAACLVSGLAVIRLSRMRDIRMSRQAVLTGTRISLFVAAILAFPVSAGARAPILFGVLVALPVLCAITWGAAVLIAQAGVQGFHLSAVAVFVLTVLAIAYVGPEMTATDSWFLVDVMLNIVLLLPVAVLVGVCAGLFARSDRTA